MQTELQSYQDQFGAIDFKRGEEARTVYSPAAYLADLLQLLDDYFGNSDEGERRPDIKDIPLDADHTFSLIPYLDIVNELLENKLPGQSINSLAKQHYPLNLPFNLADENVRLFLQYHETQRQRIHQLFHAQQPDEIARDALGLSPEMRDAIVDASKESDEEALRTRFKLGEEENLHQVAVFLDKTGVNAETLLEVLHPSLIFQEIELRSQYFTTVGLNGYPQLDSTETTLIWRGNDNEADGIPAAWFSRAARLIRLSQQSGISITDLHIALRSCCNNLLDKQAIQYLAVIKHIAGQYDLAFDIACSLFSQINTDWQQDAPPNDLFNRLFNNRFVDLERRYLSIGQPVPASYTDQNYTTLAYRHELFAASNAPLRERIRRALNLTDNDLQRLVTAFDTRLASAITEDEGSNSDDALSRLSFYHRAARLAELMDISIEELAQLLDLLELDPGIRDSQGFATLIHYPVTELNAWQILARGTVPAQMWLVQLLLALAKWMQDSEFSAAELKTIVSGAALDEAQQQLVSGFNALYEQIRPRLFNAYSLVSGSIDERTSRVLHNALIAMPDAPVSSKDSRLLKTGKEGEIRQAIQTALGDLQTIRVDDFKGLGIAQKMQDKIISSLTHTGLLKADGALIEDALPEDDTSLAIDYSFDNGQVFAVIAGALQDYTNGSQSPEGFSLFPSDFETLEMTAAASRCLYENLIHNNHIDEQGNVLVPEFFANIGNQHSFNANTTLGDYAPQISELIQRKTSTFEEAECRLEESLFAELPLKDIERTDLIENLLFNDYINEERNILNKQALLELSPDDMELALQYYPYRKSILAIIQQQIQQLKSDYYHFSGDDFSALAEQIVAEKIHASLQQHFLDNDRLTGAGVDFFGDEDNTGGLDLGDYFDANSSRIVFKTVVRITESAQRYQLRAADLEPLELESDEQDELLQLLKENGHINADGSLSPQQTDDFLTINNALAFELPDYEDFAKDTFFIIHELARRIDETVNELTSSLTELAQLQADTLFAALQEMLEIPADLVQIISQHVLGSAQNLPEQFLAPLLSAVDHKDQISSLPGNRIFTIALRRIRQFARLAAKLDLNAVESDIVFRDQNLADKFTEKLSLPAGINRIDCLLRVNVLTENFPQIQTEAEILNVILLYHSDAQRYWLYDSEDYSLLANSDDLSPLGLGATTLDAGFNDQQGNAWIISGAELHQQQNGQSDWEQHEKTLGLIDSNFDAPEKIDAAFMDEDGKLYLFVGDQYLRSSDNLDSIDEGYPKAIEGNWPQEHGLALPDAYNESIDAAFTGSDERQYFFKDQHFINSDDFSAEIPVSDFWGKIDNRFADDDKPLENIDAAFVHNDTVCFFAGEQCLSWSFGIENPDGNADEGSLKSLSSVIQGLPDAFEDGIDAILQTQDGKIHLFKDAHSLRCNEHFHIEEEHNDLKQQWGRVTNPLASRGKVSAALTGLDGKTYLFSGNKFYRYSGTDYRYVDEGYPKSIAEHWGGLSNVDAAFILDGKTYLIDNNGGNRAIYVRYSSNDYSTHDTDYPQPVTDNWWTDHFNLNQEDHAADFTRPDTVFIGKDGVTYLFKGQHYIAYDKLHRWWSEPAQISERWAGFDLEQVDAAFTGKDGRTWLFSHTKHLRYSDKHFNKLDDRYPKASRSSWGQVKNNIQKNNRIDAALILDDSDEAGVATTRTYLFSGDQYVRYSTSNYSRVDEGYPRSLSHLSEEPRFANLAAPIEGRIDAAFADQRNVYLFQQQQCTVVSDSAYKHYNNRTPEPVQAVVQDQGAVFIETETGWQQLPGLERENPPVSVAYSPLLSRIPQGISNISAAFIGVDDTAYVFGNDGQCYNDALEKSYPLNEEWGREHNRIIEDNHVDAAFTANDGKTYIFSGDQYFIYTADSIREQTPGLAEGHARSIAEDWGGLENVHIAFIRDEKTWLLEAPDAYGEFRYLCYANDEYSEPLHPPQSADISWWKFPSIYIEEGFEQVDAVLIEDEHLYLFHGSEFIQYNSEEDIWTYPRPLNRIWRNTPFNEDSGKNIAAVFNDNHGKTWFFSDSHYALYTQGSFSVSETPQRIDSAWGKIDNTIVNNNRVDAAIVLDEKTYLFSGQQYVRYSGSDYRHIDPGYPKTIAGELRQEEAFKQLPESFDERMQALGLQQEPQGIHGIAADERNIYLFETQHCHVVSQALTGQFPITRLGQIKNNLQSNGQVDAAFVNQASQTFLFSGDQYVRYSGNDYAQVDMGYPKAIRSHFAQENPGIAINSTGIDAAVQLASEPNQSAPPVLLFSGDRIHISGVAQPLPLSERVSSTANTFAEGVDCGFIDAAGVAWFFKDGQHIRYSDFSNEYVDEGYPKAIRDHWGNLPADFEERIDHSFVFEGKNYLVRGEEYVRYSHPDYQRVDALYPQAFTYRWGQWADYLLSDIRTIAAFKELLEQNLSADYSLQDLLNLELGYKKEPYRMLADIFGWDINQIKWIKRKNAFLGDDFPLEVNFNIELVLKMHAMFQIANKLGTSPQRLYHDFWQHDFQQQNTAQAAQQLHQWLHAKTTSDKDWQTPSRELHDKQNQLKHAALLPYVIAHEDGVDNARDLFAKLLIDVNMGADARTSKIKEAISALQLYIHRYFVNLENGPEGERREQLKDWWQWMRNYRVWEANRKVFLYPENYIRPELRDSKSPAFQKLEEALLQGEVNQQLVSTAFNNYLNEFAQVGNLKIIGANVYTDERHPDDDSLVLFGHSRTEPPQYYYRTARFTRQDQGQSNASIVNDRVFWDNWLPVDISINSTRVFPVYAFGRIMVFWTEIEAYEETKPSILTKNKPNANSTSRVETDDTVLKHRADIKYSFYDFNRQWVIPQTLTKGVELEYRIDAAYSDTATQELITFSGEYCLISTVKNPQGDIKLISEQFSSLPRHFHAGIDAAVLHNSRLIFFKGSKCAIRQTGSNQWEEKDIKQHFKQTITEGEHQVFKLLAWSPPIPKDYIPYSSGIAAAFAISDSQLCLIDHQGLPLFFVNAEGDDHYEEKELVSKADIENWRSDPGAFKNLIIAFIKIITRGLVRLEPVDAVFEDENRVLYVLRSGQYECYQHVPDAILPLQKLDGFPKPIKGNLSFNMDKFFNRLHLVTIADPAKDEEIINLTYVSPEANTTLLTGQVKADFTFDPGDLRTDYQTHTIWRMEKLASRSTVLQPLFPATGTLQGHLQKLADNIDAARQNISTLSADGIIEKLNARLEKYRIMLGVSGKLVKQQQNSPEEKITIVQEDLNAFYGAAIDPELPNKEIIELVPGMMAFEEQLAHLHHHFHLFAENTTVENWGSRFRNFADSHKDASGLVDAHTADSLLHRELDGLTRALTTDPSPGHTQEASRQIHASAQQGINNYRSYIQSTEQAVDRIEEDYKNRFSSSDVAAAMPEKLKASLKKTRDALAETTTALNTYETAINDSENKLTSFNEQLESLTLPATEQAIGERINALEATLQALKTASPGPSITTIQQSLTELEENADAIKEQRQATQIYNQQIKELYFGHLDVFPTDFQIQNRTNFTFGEPDWHIFEAKMGTFLCRPLDNTNEGNYQIIRLTTTSIPALSRTLFAGGIDRLLTLNTQGIDELPYFKPHPVEETPRSLSSVDQIDGIQDASNTIGYNPRRIPEQPESKHLDYQGANKNYYWEIFFHAPFLIAQALNDAQKFEEAKRWYEYIFDPTKAENNWGFLPFKQASDKRASLETQLNSPLVVEDLKAEIDIYLNDPFDPHAIAGVRQLAYQKAMVMRYIDNLLDWGDMLFRQYSVESINEARMLYVLAYDLLGDKPQSMGNKILPKTRSYNDLKNDANETELVLPAKTADDGQTTELIIVEGTSHQSVENPYFHIPENDLFLDYWNRVEDRLYKIRNSLNIDGVKQALPLFQPPIDPMSIVQAVAGGGGLSQIMAGSSVAVPHYRFSFMLYKARELAQKLNQFGGELLSAIEKRDAEQLSLLQNKQQSIILDMMTQVKEAQIEEAKTGIASLEASLAMVEANEQYNQGTVDTDFLPAEIAQMSLMGGAVAAHLVSVIARTVASVGGAAPDALVGPFIAGIKIGGAQAHAVAGSIAEVAQTGAEGLSVGGELSGIVAQHQRMMADTEHQADTAIHDREQIQAQIKGAEQQLKIAQYELSIHEKERDQQQSIQTFMTGKFSNERLYQWMSSQLSGLYYQSYKMAWDMAKAAEKAFQYERGIKESDVNYISGNYWNSQRKGLLAGESLGLDLDRMEQAFIETDQRRLEIAKTISLLELDPLAFLRLKSRGDCEFTLTESLFDYDFQGHYCRQIKTIAIEFDAPEGATVNATLTQLNHNTVMEPDPKAVKYLIEPKDSQPLSIRSDWRASQQIALSHVDEYEKPNGLFELRFDDDRYLPFEGTGAVSRWRLELNGKRSAWEREELLDATITIKYTALQGGEAFGDAVRGLLKPYDTVRFIDLNYDFHEQWLAFLENDERSLSLHFTREHFPDMAGSRITGLFTRLQTEGDAAVSLLLNDDDNMPLHDQQFTDTAGLSVRATGSDWRFTVQGNKAALKNVQLVIGYKANV